MHRLFLGVALAFLTSTLVLTGCGKAPPVSGAGPADDDSSPGAAKPFNPAQAKPDDPADPLGPAPLDTKTDPDTLPVLPELTPPTGPEKYEACVSKAFTLMAEKKDPEALAALQEAQAAQDTDFVKTEIERLQSRVTKSEAAQKAADDIKVVIEAGQGEQASKLAADALAQYGDADLAVTFTALKTQADALLNVQLGGAGKQKLLDDAETARKANNHRAALVAYEQAVAGGADPGPLKDAYEQLRAKLASYDDNRAKATECRKDPSQLEQAVTVLKAAAESWDTPQVRQEISECEAAIQNRRDRVAIADFEVNDEVGIARAGHVVAEELTGAMRPRFDVVERAQAQKLLDEMKVDHTVLASNDTVRTEFGKVAKARYVVLGSVNRIGGISVSARLVDTQTGLIVQTARMSAATPDDLVNRLPALGRMLQMTDDEKRAYEQQLAEKARPVTVAPVSAEVPPPPPPPTQAAAAPAPPPAPIVMYTPRPPAYGEIVVADYGNFQVIQAGAAPPPPVVIVEAPQPVQQRAFFVAVELGDNCYRRGDFRLALKHWEFAVTLNPGHADLRLRLAQCRPLCPPPVEVVVVTRPRMIVLPFAEFRDPFHIPSSIDPGLGVWTAGAFAPYLSNRYDLVDGGEVYWWMGRLGLTMRDVLINPAARLCLARAVGARYFLMGSFQEVASFDVTARVIDAELNGQVAGAMMRVQNSAELRYRLPELAAGMFAPPPPAQTIVVIQQQPVVQQRLVAAQIEYRKGNFSVAFGMYQEIGTQYPTCYEARSLTIELEFRSRRSEREAREAAMWRQQAGAYQAERERQIALAAAAEGARQQARRDLEFMQQAQKTEIWKQQVLAQQAMVAQAQAMQAQNMAAQRAAMLQAAAQIHQNQEVQAQLIQARAAAAVQQQQAMRTAALANMQAIHNQQVAAVQQVQANVATAVAQQQKQMQATQTAIINHVNDEYTQFVTFGKNAEASSNYPAAVTAYQNAKRLKDTPEIEALIAGALNKQALAQAALKGEVEKKKVEGGIAQEMIKNQQMENALAAQKAKHDAQFKAAQQAMALKQYEQAAKAYREAAAAIQSQEAMAGIKAAEAEMNKAKLAADFEVQKQKAEQKRLGTAAEKLAEGRSALAAKDAPRALAALRSAKALKPGDVEIETALTQAESLQEQVQAAARQQQETRQKIESLQQQIAVGKKNLQAKQFDAAIVAFTEAVRIDSKNPEANAGLQSAQAAQKELAKDQTAIKAAEQKRADYTAAMQKGRAAINLKQYSDALGFFQKAQDTLPGDVASAEMIREATKLKSDADAAQARSTAAATAKKDPVVTPKTDPTTKVPGKADALVAKARAAIQAKDMAAAYQAIVDASRLDPRDPEVLKVRSEYETARKEMSTASAGNTDVQKKQAQYEAAMSAAQTALTAKKYEDAIARANEALAVKPGDAAATRILTDAKKAESTAEAAATEAKKKDEAYRLDIQEATAALAAKKYDDAIRDAQAALAIKPGDAIANRIISDAQKAKAAATTGPSPAETAQAAYDKAMQAGRTAYSARKFDESLQHFEDALKAKPGDPTATQSIAVVKKAIATTTTPDPKKDTPPAKTTTPGPMSPTIDPQRKKVYDAWLTRAEELMAAKKYPDAVQAYENCLKAIPDDPAATKGLAAARTAMASAAPPIPPKKDPVAPMVPPKTDPVVPKADPTAARVAALMKEAAADEKAGNYGEAAKSYQDVLKLAPTNAEAKKRASFCQWMDQGKSQVAGGKASDAVSSFNQALAVDPNDANAKRLLQQAQQQVQPPPKNPPKKK